ncbi:MAG: hypothetical protein OXH38_13290 [Chloroflexi bacterium]|nr:hypothetical protein [Chloroflexota bacterium]
MVALFPPGSEALTDTVALPSANGVIVRTDPDMATVRTEGWLDSAE